MWLLMCADECAPGCPTSWIGDGYCDDPMCMNTNCAFDGGDCDNVSGERRNVLLVSRIRVQLDYAELPKRQPPDATRIETRTCRRTAHVLWMH